MGRKSLNKERKDNPKKKLEWIEILIPYFQKNGLKSITMDEVASVLNKSKATVYKYFKSKEEIIEFGLGNKLEHIQHFEEILKDENTPYLDRYFKSIEHLTLHISDISNLFLSDLKHLYPEIWKRVSAFIEYAISIIIDYYKEGINLNIFDNINPSLMAMSDRYFFASLSDPDFLISNNLSITEAFNQYFRMKFFGIVKDHSLLADHAVVV